MIESHVTIFLKTNNVLIAEAEEVGGITQPSWSAIGRWLDRPPRSANRGGPPGLRQAEAEAPPQPMCPRLRSRGAQLRPLPHVEVGLQLDPVSKPWRAHSVWWTQAQTCFEGLPPMFKIEALTWVSFWRTLKFQPLRWRASSNPRRQSKNIKKITKLILNLCINIWYMFLVQCEELRGNHLTPLLVVTMPYACWFLWWWADYIKDFKWRLHFQFGVAFSRVVLREVYFEGPNRIWRTLKTSILNIVSHTLKGIRVRVFFRCCWRVGFLVTDGWFPQLPHLSRCLGGVSG